MQVYEQHIFRVFWEGKDVTEQVAPTLPTLSELCLRVRLELENVPAAFDVTYDEAKGYASIVDIDRELVITVSNVVQSTLNDRTCCPKCQLCCKEKKKKKHGLICRVL